MAIRANSLEIEPIKDDNSSKRWFFLLIIESIRVTLLPTYIVFWVFMREISIKSLILRKKIFVSEMSSKSLILRRTCALSLDARFCPYRVRTTESSEWITICLLARNRVCSQKSFDEISRFDLFSYFRRNGVRDEWYYPDIPIPMTHRLKTLQIAAVCDFFTYLRYLSLGIIKTDLRDSYFEIIALRKNMALARLGLGFVPRTSLPRRGSGF